MATAQQRGAQAAGEIGRDCLAVRVRLLSRTITRIYDTALRPHGLTIAQLNLLTSVASWQPARAGDIARLLSMEISTLSRNAHLLHEEGLLEVEHAEHGNGRVLSITDAGAERLEQLRPAWRAAQEQAQELLGEDATRSIVRLGDRMFGDTPAAR
jgi:DNA-binding MarR family transcriptional regulator